MTARERVEFRTAVAIGTAAGFVWGLGDFFAALFIKTSFGVAAGLGLARIRSPKRSLEPQGS